MHEVKIQVFLPTLVIFKRTVHRMTVLTVEQTFFLPIILGLRIRAIAH